MKTLARPPYIPFTDPRMSRPPGLMPLDPADWFVIHGDFAGQMAYRDELLAGQREMVAAQLPDGRAAARELLESVVDTVAHLPGYRFGDGVVTRPDGVAVTIDTGDPLVTAGRLVADDLLLLLPDAASGEYRLVGAVVCFPSRWLLAEKMGRPLTVIHDPVPDYDSNLARRVNRVFEALRVEHPLWRVNWIVHDSTELYLPLASGEKYVTPDHPAPGHFLRTERQTLVRLPRTGAVVFGVKTSISPIESLTASEASALRNELLAYSADTITYKASADSYRLALDRLAEIACQGRAGSAS